ncbi:protease complex subunit PrcB family protein [bacterium]|nr:protease complex subunit PrcB family protein [bacterium]
MKRRVLKLIGMGLALLLIMGCQKSLVKDEGKIEPLPKFTTIERGYYSGYKDAERLVVRRKRTWKKVWNIHTRQRTPSPSLPVINFKKEMIIAVFRNERQTSGYQVEITDIEKKGSEIVVTIKETSPQPGDIVMPILTQPYHIVKIKRSIRLIRFVEE